MAESLVEPAPVRLVGHDWQQALFLDAFRRDQLHHAWLLTGPRGIGKASFAAAAARYVLACAAGPADRVERDRLEVDPDHPIARLISAGSHPDLRLLERLPRAADGKLAAQISIDQVRGLQPLLHGTPSFSPWRIVIVDSVDDLNRNAANALLKSLEEPPPRSLFLLVSHAPGRLPPTLRSRCRRLAFRLLAPDAVRAVVGTHVSAEASELDALVEVAGGAPGVALRYAGLDVAGLRSSLVELHRLGPRATAAAARLANRLAAKAAQPRYEAFLELAPSYIAAAARIRHGPALAKALALWDKAQALAGEAVMLSLEPQLVALRLSTLVSELGE